MQNIQTIIGPTVFADGVSMARIAFDIESGLIISVDRNNIIPAKSDNYIYSGDCLIFPGMGDIHIHAREDASQKNIYKEDFFSCCEAAINGGVAHVADMPNNPIPPIDDESYKNKLALTLKHKLPNQMRGTPCSPGVIEGVVKVIIDSNDDMTLNGEILVTERTDPGWIPLYPSVSALLVERGGLLSHSAIVAREMGLPTIVGIKGLTKKLKSGMKIRINGETGLIEILEE